jgi:integrase
MPRKRRTQAVARLDLGARIVRRPGLRPMYLEVSRSGIQRRYNLHTCQKARAIEAGRQILARINEPGPDRWNWKANGGRLPSGSTRLVEWIEDYVEHLRTLQRRTRTIEANNREARRFLAYVRDAQLRADRNPMLRDVTPDLVQRFMAHLFDVEHLAPPTINHARGVLSGMFNVAVERGLIEPGGNPIPRTKPLKMIRRVRATPTEAEVARLLKAAMQPVPNVGRGGKGPEGSFRERSPLVHDVAVLIVNSGLRLMEALTLRWDELEMTGGMYEGGTLYVRSKPENLLKDYEERTVPINDAIRELLLRRRQLVPKECPWVYPTWGGRPLKHGKNGRPGAKNGSAGAQDKETSEPRFRPQRRDTFYRDLALAAERTGIEPPGRASAQALRRFFATVNARTGMPPFVLKQLMGHSSLETTQRHYVAGWGGGAGPGWTPLEIKGSA